AKALARGKANDVASKISKGLVIGMDTFVAFAGKKIGKPKDEADAARMLRAISGKEVDVFTGLAIIDANDGKELLDFERTKVRMHEMSDKEIAAYIRTGEPMDKAGAFAIQGLGAIFVRDISGCYSNITGTPIYRLSQALQKFGVSVHESEDWKNHHNL
ncbi:Maf family protein, partial [Candidatus Woesearchaeota archaeon]|nr:Maf family protein [Candidatus Woesearchaeota archaeon]